VPVAKITARASKTAPKRVSTFQRPSSPRVMATTSACFSKRFGWRSNFRFIILLYSRRSICILREWTAGPFPRLSIRLCKKHSSVVRPISPPSASISRTRCPFAVPPIDGLHGQFPTASRLMVKTTVLQPRRAAARDASIPA